MAVEYESVDVWIGQFSSQEALDAYLEETYDEDDEDKPVSQFAADQGETFYDSDFIETNFAEGGGSIDDLTSGMSFIDSFIEQLKAAYEPAEDNTVIFSFGQQFENGKSIQGDGYSLKYLGSFACKPD